MKGAATAATLTETATASSATATGVLPKPPVDAVTAGRTMVVLAACTVRDVGVETCAGRQSECREDPGEQFHSQTLLSGWLEGSLLGGFLNGERLD